MQHAKSDSHLLDSPPLNLITWLKVMQLVMPCGILYRRGGSVGRYVAYTRVPLMIEIEETEGCIGGEF
jgi:hypothetical protein